MSQAAIETTTRIAGVQLVELKSFADGRGEFMETFRVSWFPQVSWGRMQANRSRSQAGVLRGLHYHFDQVDYWTVPNGRARACLVDLRASSPTYLRAMSLDMGDDNPVGLFIPVGVAHGFAALTDCEMAYVVNNYYDGDDEFGVAWNDPQFDLDWAVADPLISDRDAANPLLADVAHDSLPG